MGSVKDQYVRDERQGFFDRTALFWETQYGDEGLRGQGVQARMALALASLAQNHLPGKAMVLDLGTGPGIMADRIAATGVRVCAVDFSYELVARAQERLAEHRHKNANVLQADAHRLPFDDETFSAVLCIALISWVRDPRQVLREMARVLRPGTSAIITVRNLFHAGDLLDPVFWLRFVVPRRLRARLRGLRRNASARRGWGPTRYRIGSFNRLLGEAGFRVTRWRTLQYGGFRIFGLSILPTRLQLTVNRACERIWWMPGVRRLGWTYFVQAVKSP